MRATNAVSACVNVRLITFLVLGAFHFSDWPMYTAASISCLIGLFVGDAIAKKVNQKAFAHLLLAMLLVSMIMLYAEGFAARHGKTQDNLGQVSFSKLEAWM